MCSIIDFDRLDRIIRHQFSYGELQIVQPGCHWKGTRRSTKLSEATCKTEKFAVQFGEVVAED